MRQEAVTVIRIDVGSVPGSAQQVERAFTGMARAGDASAGQIKAAMRSLPAQFTDVATSLAGGQSPLMVLLQQGGQIRDQFGSIGAALRGIGSFITPATLGVGAVAALGGVLIEAGRDAGRLRDALALTNNAAGLTADGIADLSRRVAEQSSATVGGARDIALALAEEGSVSVRVLESMTLAVARVADVSGKSSAEVAKDFAAMGRGVADWAAQHNRAWNFITADQYRYIKALEDQGRAEEAAIFVNKQIIGQLQVQRENLGLLESAWNGLKAAASGAWQAMLGVGRADTVGEQIQAAQADLGRVEQRLADARNSPVRTAGVGLMERERDALRERIRNLQEMQRLEQRGAEAASARAAEEQRKIEALRNAKPAKVDKNDWSAGRVVDPFGDFIRGERGATDEVNRALQQRIDQGLDQARRAAAKAEQEAQQAEAKRLASQADLLQSLVDANAKANAELIADDEQRAIAQIEIERRLMQRRIDAVTEAGSAERAAAEALADQETASRVQAAQQRFAAKTADITREEVRDALAEAFRDAGGNPAKAFADSLGNLVFQRLSTALADAIVTGLVGTGKPGSDGGLLGQLLPSAIGWLGGGAPVDFAAQLAAGMIPLATGTNYVPRDMPAMLHQGEAVVPRRYNPAAGGAQAGASRTVSITLAPVISIDARSDQAQVAQLVAGAMAQTQRDMWATMKARGLA